MISSSIKLSFTGVEVGCTTKTSAPRTFSPICTRTSPSGNRPTLAWPTSILSCSQISLAKAGWALPQKILSGFRFPMLTPKTAVTSGVQTMNDEHRRVLPIIQLSSFRISAHLWLGGLDSNQGSMLQRHVSYHWTTSQKPKRQVQALDSPWAAIDGTARRIPTAGVLRPNQCAIGA